MLDFIATNAILGALNEAAVVEYGNYSFIMRLDTNEDPQKKGIKIQFHPKDGIDLNPTEQNDLAIAIEDKLEDGLSDYGIKVERDRMLRDKSIIGFFVYLEYIDRLVRQALQKEDEEEETINLDRTSKPKD